MTKHITAELDYWRAQAKHLAELLVDTHDMLDGEQIDPGDDTCQTVAAWSCEACGATLNDPRERFCGFCGKDPE